MTPELVKAIRLRLRIGGVWETLDKKYFQQELLVDFNAQLFGLCGQYDALTVGQTPVEEICLQLFRTLNGIFRSVDNMSELYERAYVDRPTQEQGPNTAIQVPDSDSLETILSYHVSYWLRIIEQVGREMFWVQAKMAEVEQAIITAEDQQPVDATSRDTWRGMRIKNHIEFNKARSEVGFRKRWPEDFVIGGTHLDDHDNECNNNFEPDWTLLSTDFAQDDECPICGQGLNCAPDLSFSAEETSSYNENDNGADHERNESPGIEDGERTELPTPTQSREKPGVVTTPCCDQLFHVACMKKWCLDMDNIHDSCPYCRGCLSAEIFILLMEWDSGRLRATSRRSNID